MMLSTLTNWLQYYYPLQAVTTLVHLGCNWVFHCQQPTAPWMMPVLLLPHFKNFSHKPANYPQTCFRTLSDLVNQSHGMELGLLIKPYSCGRDREYSRSKFAGRRIEVPYLLLKMRIPRQLAYITPTNQNQLIRKKLHRFSKIK